MIEQPACALRIVIAKALRRLSVEADGTVVRCHPVVVGQNDAVDKSREGDCATPLGEFFVCAKNPLSKYHRSLCLSYPSAAHAERGLAAGLIDTGEYDAIMKALQARRMPPQYTRLGGEIYIHGRGKNPRTNSTRGCIALEDEAMQELYDSARLGTDVLITP